MKKNHNFLTRNQFLRVLKNLFFGFIALINFPFASTKLKKEKVEMFKITDLPQNGPWPTSDPFLFCVHHKDNYPIANDNLGPKDNLFGRNIGNDFSDMDGWSMYHGTAVPGFPRHPHRGFETITIVEKGLIDHSDSMGFSARYGDGDVQWLTAGDGIQHSEMFPLLNGNDRNPIDFFQIWINLSSKNKRVTPNFKMFWKNDIPKITKTDKNNLKSYTELIAGSYSNQKAPSPPQNSWAKNEQNNVNIWKIKLDEGADYILPEVEKNASRTLYFYKGGKILANGVEIQSKSMIEINNSNQVIISSTKGQAHILLLQGNPIEEPVVQYGPFVMNTKSEIQEAFDDYNKTNFGDWGWAEDGPVHGSNYEKFSKQNK